MGIAYSNQWHTNYSEHNFTNILLIITDQQRYDSLGSYGCKAARTPNIDLMAEQGVVFENCVVTNPMCVPSRASLWTGKELPGHGVCQQLDGLRSDEVLFSKHLQNKGYYTGLFGKLQVSNEPRGCFNDELTKRLEEQRIRWSFLPVIMVTCWKIINSLIKVLFFMTHVSKSLL